MTEKCVSEAGTVLRPCTRVHASAKEVKLVTFDADGRAVQVEPPKSMLKAPGQAPGPMHLKLTCDEPLSNFAFNCHLRRYMMARCTRTASTSRYGGAGGPGETQVESAWK